MKGHSIAVFGLTALITLLYSGVVPAQIDLSGSWYQESDQASYIPGPYADDFSGIPINKQGREAALSYSGDERQELNRQCEPWSANYLVLAPWGGRFTPVRDNLGRVIAWQVGAIIYDRLPMTIWVDGRSAPPAQAVHTYEGFTTGYWEGDTLVTQTTHLKDSYLERNGVPSSDQQTLTMFFTRHGDEMMLTGIVRDPVYLDAPWVVATTLRLNVAAATAEPVLYCMPAETTGSFLGNVSQTDGRQTAAELPDQIQTQKDFMTRQYNYPLDAAMGGAQTMYPDFRKRVIAEGYKPPAKCTYLCCDQAPRGQRPVCHLVQ